MEKYRVSFFDVSEEGKLKPVILQFEHYEVYHNLEMDSLFRKAEEIQSKYMSKRSKELGSCMCDGLEVWKKSKTNRWEKLSRLWFKKNTPGDTLQQQLKSIFGGVI